MYAHNLGKDRAVTPLFAVSGRTGRMLWSAEMQTRHVSGVHSLDTRDLDGDSLAEVIWVGASDRDFPESRPFNIHQQQLELVVLSGSSGRMIWHEALTSRYGLTPQTNTPPYQFDQGWVAVSYGDLNADGVLDVLVPADSPSESPTARQELRAIDGRTGEVLWRYTLPPVQDTFRALSEAPPSLVVDLDGDSRPEVVALTFDGPAESGRSSAVLHALEATDGRERWSCRFDVPNNCGQLFSDEQRRRCRPRPMLLHTAEGPPLVASIFGTVRNGSWSSTRRERSFPTFDLSPSEATIAARSASGPATSTATAATSFCLRTTIT